MNSPTSGQVSGVTVRPPHVQVDKLVRAVADGEAIPREALVHPLGLIAWLSLVVLTTGELSILHRALQGYPIGQAFRVALATEMVISLDRCLEHDDCIDAALAGNAEMGWRCKNPGRGP